jgi:hypothetical protein
VGQNQLLTDFRFLLKIHLVWIETLKNKINAKFKQNKPDVYLEKYTFEKLIGS